MRVTRNGKAAGWVGRRKDYSLKECITQARNYKMKQGLQNLLQPPLTAIFETATVLNSVQSTVFVTNPKMDKFKTFPGINSHVDRHIFKRSAFT